MLSYIQSLMRIDISCSIFLVDKWVCSFFFYRRIVTKDQEKLLEKFSWQKRLFMVMKNVGFVCQSFWREFYVKRNSFCCTFVLVRPRFICRPNWPFRSTWSAPALGSRHSAVFGSTLIGCVRPNRRTSWKWRWFSGAAIRSWTTFTRMRLRRCATTAPFNTFTWLSPGNTTRPRSVVWQLFLLESLTLQRNEKQSLDMLCMYRICRNKRPSRHKRLPKTVIFQRGEYTKPMGFWWVIFQRGEYTKPMSFDGWFFKGGGGYTKPMGFWRVFEGFLKKFYCL